MIVYALRAEGGGVLDHNLRLIDGKIVNPQDVAWAINHPEGSIRSSSTGQFLSVRANCLEPVMTFDRFVDWKLTRSDDMDGWTIQSGCGGFLSYDDGQRTTNDNRLIMLQSDSRFVPHSWDIVAIGTTVEPKDVAMQYI